MKAIPAAVFAAATLAVAAASAPVWLTPVKAAEPAAAEPPPTEERLGEWKGVHIHPDGIPPANIDADAAYMLARKNGCLRCHAIDRIKTGPAYKSVAEAYKNDLKGGEEREVSHLTAGDIFVLNGNVDHHPLLRTDPPGDVAQLKNLIYWIFSLDK